MEALYAVIGFVVVMGILWAISYLLVRVVGPRRSRTRVLASLQAATVIGDSDVSTNLTAAAKRWIDLKRGVEECRGLHLESYQSEIKQQLLILQPHAKVLDEKVKKMKDREVMRGNISDLLDLIP